MKNSSVLFLFIISFFVTVFLNSCAVTDTIRKEEILPSERLINKLEANRRRINTFEGYGSMHVKTDLLDTKALFRVVLHKPDSIYLTIMGPFGMDLAQILVTPSTFYFYDVLQNTVFQGQANEDVLKLIFKINLSFSQLMDSFIGSVNLTKKLYKKPDKFEVVYDKYYLTYNDEKENELTKYTIDVRELSIVNYVMSNLTGEEILVGEYSKFKFLENVSVPYYIQVKNVKENQTVTINYKSMVANKKNIFVDFQIPNDAKIIRW